MFTRILVPLDGSQRAERAVPVAARIARASGSEVRLVRVTTPLYTGFYMPVAAAPGVGLPSPMSLQDIDTMNTEAQSYLSTIAQWPVLTGVTVQTSVFTGPAGQTLLHTIEESHVDLVVMASHGRTGPSRWVLGSVAQHIARHSPAPVLVLHVPDPSQESALADGTRTPRMLVTLDSSQVAESVLEPAADLSIALKGATPASLHLLLVVDRYVAALAAAPEALVMGGAEAYLMRVAEKIKRERDGAVKVTSSVIGDLDIAEAILHVATPSDQTAQHQPDGYDLIAMATHGLSGVSRWVLGSVTERVLHGSTLPLLIVRPQHITAAASPLTLPQP